ncbi:type III secretion system stalk subunit SctO [Salinicola lusitanus]|uniref:type III secretion system stalk subunit SctO n=1 Tax=Salinicola lusitanus TaxID=1949085 RepID=UPI000DA157AB|nr:YscO family type III secretion system apparatus protein [Salinicola lusitanus]
MTSLHPLERLIQLRRHRTRRAEEALMASQRRCRELDARHQALEITLDQHQRASRHREQALFDDSAQQPMGAETMAAWQQTLADDAGRQESLLQQRRTLARERRTADAERDERAAEWARCRRAEQALDRLQADRSRALAVDAERLAELEMEEMRPPQGALR